MLRRAEDSSSEEEESEEDMSRYDPDGVSVVVNIRTFLSQKKSYLTV